MSKVTQTFALAVLLVPLTAASAANDPFGPEWPEGPAREEVGYFCSACHSLDLVRQQGLSRTRWDHLLSWMTATQNMPPLEGEERARFLDYLAANFGEDRSVGSSGVGGEIRGGSADQGVGLAPLSIRPPD